MTSNRDTLPADHWCSKFSRKRIAIFRIPLSYNIFVASGEKHVILIVIWDYSCLTAQTHSELFWHRHSCGWAQMVRNLWSHKDTAKDTDTNWQRDDKLNWVLPSPTPTLTPHHTVTAVCASVKCKSIKTLILFLFWFGFWASGPTLALCSQIIPGGHRGKGSGCWGKI